MEKYSKNIKDFWEKKAKEHETSFKSSWEDYYCIQLEIETIDKLLSEDDEILDIGCGNGLSTLELAFRKKIKIKGIDYSEGMIKSAQKLLLEKQNLIKGTVSFDISDVLNLKEQEKSFTKVISRRVIINIETLDGQIEAAKEIHKVLKPDGFFLMSEATIDGLQKINTLRKEFGLDELKQPWHNLYIDEHEFIKRLSKFYEVVDILNFSSTYYIGSRVIQPFVKNLLNQSPAYLSEVNRLFMCLPPFGDYGIQKLFVLRKT